MESARHHQVSGRGGICDHRPVAAGSSAVQLEVFHHTRAKEQVRPKQNLFPVVCRVIEVLGDEFDGFVFHSQFRYDLQFSGSTWGHFPGNVPTRGVGFTEGELRRKSPCGRRMRGQWRYSVWTKSDYVAVRSGGYAVSPRGPWLLATSSPTPGRPTRTTSGMESPSRCQTERTGFRDCTAPGLSSAAGASWAGFPGARTRTERSPPAKPECGPT